MSKPRTTPDGSTTRCCGCNRLIYRQEKAGRDYHYAVRRGGAPTMFICAECLRRGK